jgi:molybdopterin/thiamine biosynthesis adenylyltransferase
MSDTLSDAGRPARFDRQIRFAPLGRAGQERIESARVLIVGCGALGGSVAQTLARCGVGTLVLVDRDIVELTNLPRQVLFEERHAREGTPKVDAARETLARIGGPTRLETHAVHLEAENLPSLAAQADLILDGTDNLPTRYLLNDFSIQSRIPWIYAGVVGSGGLVLPVTPDAEPAGPCLRCLFPEPPPPGSLDTCETAGVILPAVGSIASMQCGLALRWLATAPAERPRLATPLLQLDAWTGDVLRIDVPRQPDCPCCVGRQFPFLDEPPTRSAVVLCGRNTVQVRGSQGRPDMRRVAAGLAGHARDVQQAGAMLRFEVEGLRVTLFPDGRALIEGTEDPGRARAVYDRYLT